MPLHDVGYREWHGQRTSPMSRWSIISSSGIRLAAKSRWVRRILFVAWLPVMYWGIGFFFVEKALDLDNTTLSTMTDTIGEVPAVQKPNVSRLAIQRSLENSFAMFPHAKELSESFASNDSDRIRNDVWRWLLMVFFRYPQAIIILFLVGSVAPSLISRDLRSRAFLLYFSRPIGKFEYIIGKLCIPSAFIMAVTTLPALALFGIAMLMSPSFSVIWSTWDIPIRIVLATFALVIPTSAVALMLSSLTQESRFANFAWFAVWAMGHGAWLTIVAATAVRMELPPVDPAVLQSTMVQTWSALSLYNCLGSAQAVIFGFEDLRDVWPEVVSLAGLTLFSLIVLYRRVSAPIQV